MYKNIYIANLVMIIAIAGCAKNDANLQGATKSVANADQYIVVLKKAQIQALSESVGGQVHTEAIVKSMMVDLEGQYQLPAASKVFSVALKGGVYQLSGDQAQALSGDARVAYIEKDQIVHVSATEASPTWGLDRIDQASLPLDKKYNYVTGGATVNAYVIDTGIFITHTDLQGRADVGADLVGDGQNGIDCNGHGTHVSGTIGSATYGVAKSVKLHAIRVLDCDGSGTYSNVIAGIEWVTAHHVSPAVANMSLGGPVSQAVDDAVTASVASGVTYVVAAGNENDSACNSSPARVDAAISVGSTNNTDTRSSFSNFGTCVDVFAPGENIKSLWFSSTTATNTISGTSMATPHVVGVAALYLSKHPAATPTEVKLALINGSIANKISDVGSGSPNKLINTQFLGSDSGTPTPTPTPTDPALKNGVDVAGLAGAKGDLKYFTYTVATKTSNLTITLSGGTGDADMYVRSASKPTTTSYTCRPYKTGNNESCSISTPAAGTWYVMLRGYAAYTGATLKATSR